VAPIETSWYREMGIALCFGLEISKMTIYGQKRQPGAMHYMHCWAFPIRTGYITNFLNVVVRRCHFMNRTITSNFAMPDYGCTAWIINYSSFGTIPSVAFFIDTPCICIAYIVGVNILGVHNHVIVCGALVRSPLRDEPSLIVMILIYGHWFL
jgi:hypothetical protein